MFDLKITDIKSAPDVARGWATVTISLLNTNHEEGMLTLTGGVHAVFEFDDLNSEKEQCRRPGMVHAPTMNDIKSILEFTETFTDDDRVLIHCHAGLCRSPSVAILALVQHGMGVEEAVKKVLEVRPQMWPNSLIIRLGDIALEMDGALIAFVNQWMDDHLRDIDWE